MKTTLVARTAITVAAVALVAAACGTRDDGTADARPTPAVTDTSGAPSETGQGSSSSPGAGGGAPETDTSTVTGGTAAPESSDPAAGSTTPRCHTADLTAALKADGAAAGNQYATLVLTNASDHACRMFGYGGVQLLDAARRPIVTTQSRDSMHKPTSFVVKPNGHASTILHWGDVPAGDEPDTTQCEPSPAMLSIIPPDETAALVTAWQGGPVCQHGKIDEWAYAPGVVSPS